MGEEKVEGVGMAQGGVKSSPAHGKRNEADAGRGAGVGKSGNGSAGGIGRMAGRNGEGMRPRRGRTGRIGGIGVGTIG